jgi:tetratricopeptide (TPR) repeat protein
MSNNSLTKTARFEAAGRFLCAFAALRELVSRQVAKTPGRSGNARLKIISCLILVTSTSALAQAPSDTVKEAQRLARVAQVAQQEGRYDDAIRAYETITVVARSSPKTAASAFLNIGNLYMAQRKYEEASKSFRRSISLDPNSAEAQNNLGETQGELKQYTPALEAFQKAIALDRTFVKARYNMGVIYDHMGRPKYAEFVFRILIRDFPDYALAYDSLAVALSKSGRAREAIHLHEKAISLEPQDASFYYNFAISYLVLGDTRRAQEQQQRVRQLDPAMAEHLAMVIAKHQR